MIQGDQPGMRWKLQENRVTTIGRSSRNEISLVHPSISRFHCEISFINGLWYIADLNSRKGTVLNGTPVTDREVLKPGDIIRLSKNVLKFDMIDETAKDDEGMMALRDAALDAKGVDVGDMGDESALDDMRLRSKLAAEEESGPVLDKKTVVNIAVIAGAGIAVAVAVIVILGVMNGKKRAAEHALEAWRQKAKSEYLQACEMLKGGPQAWTEARGALEAVARQYPGTGESKAAVEKCREVEAMMLEAEMGRIDRAERAGNFAEAIEREKTLQEQVSDPALDRLLVERREFTERQAKENFNFTKKQVETLLADGKVEEVLRTLEDLKERIGVPELKQLAEFQIKLVKSKGSAAEGDIFKEPAAPETKPQTEPKPEPKPADTGAKPKQPPPATEVDVEALLKPPPKDGGTGAAQPEPPGDEQPKSMTPDGEKPKREKPRRPPKGPDQKHGGGDDAEDNFRPPTAL
jgi:pSer/pThr/pTyr-binding forkhead associated (FHA) protein